MGDILTVRMLGRFSIELHEKSIDDSSNRMKKVWLLLAYLIYARNQRVTQEGLQALLNGNNSSDALDANGRLKAMLYRARALLNQMDESCGHDLIIRKNGTYAWNTEVPIRLDVDVFESLCKEAAKAEDKEICLQIYLEAIDLYKGDFLAKLSTESWVIPISVYYHEMYLRVVGETLLLLEEAGRWNDGIEICEKALKIEPYSEELYQHLMRCRISAGDRAGAQMAYEEMSEILFSNFGVMPSEESRQLYRTAAR